MTFRSGTSYPESIFDNTYIKLFPWQLFFTKVRFVVNSCHSKIDFHFIDSMQGNFSINSGALYHLVPHHLLRSYDAGCFENSYGL